MTQEAAQLRLCKQCEKPLLGRSDPKFCNDSCRNNFNKSKPRPAKIDPHENQKAIFSIIKRNYDILKRAYRSPIDPNRYEYIAVAKMDKDFD